MLQTLPACRAAEAPAQLRAGASAHGREGRDQLLKAPVSDEGCLNIHLLITQMEAVCCLWDGGRLGTHSVKHLQVWV